jgi:hypothetical protein
MIMVKGQTQVKILNFEKPNPKILKIILSLNFLYD